MELMSLLGFMGMSWVLISLIWTIPLKGYSMWLSARRNQPIWFILLLIIQTMGIFELIYLLIYGFKEKPKKAIVVKKKPRARKTKR